MGRRRPYESRKLSASSLLETVLAMSLMACALGFALWLHVRILETDRSMWRMQAWSMTERLLAMPSIADLPANGTGAIDVEVRRESVGPGMERITFTCSRAGQVLLTRDLIQPEP